MKIAEYSKSRRVQRDDVVTAIEEHCPGQSTSGNANLTAETINRLDEFFNVPSAREPNQPDPERPDPGEQPGVPPQPQRPTQTPTEPKVEAPPQPVRLPAGVKPFGTPDGGRHLWRVEFKGKDAEYAYAYGHDEPEAISLSLAGLRRSANGARYVAVRCEA